MSESDSSGSDGEMEIYDPGSVVYICNEDSYWYGIILENVDNGYIVILFDDDRNFGEIITMDHESYEFRLVDKISSSLMSTVYTIIKSDIVVQCNVVSKDLKGDFGCIYSKNQNEYAFIAHDISDPSESAVILFNTNNSNLQFTRSLPNSYSNKCTKIKGYNQLKKMKLVISANVIF